MSANTLETILQHHHSKYLMEDEHKNGTLTQLTFRIHEDLFVLDNSGHLAAESKIFLTCSNSSQHILNIVKKVFIDIIPDKQAIAEELELIINESGKSVDISTLEEKLLNFEERLNEKLNEKSNSIELINLGDKISNMEEMLRSRSDSDNTGTILDTLLHMEERLKQSFFARTCQIHSHLNHSDVGDRLSEMADLKIETDRVLSDKLAKLERAQDFLRDEFSRFTVSLVEYQKATSIITENAVGRVNAAMFPPMLDNEIGKHLEPLKVSIASIKSDTTSLKKSKQREASSIRNEKSSGF